MKISFKVYFRTFWPFSAKWNIYTNKEIIATGKTYGFGSRERAFKECLKNYRFFLRFYKEMNIE